MTDPSPRTPNTVGEVLGVVILETLRRSSQNVLIVIRNQRTLGFMYEIALTGRECNRLLLIPDLPSAVQVEVFNIFGACRDWPPLLVVLDRGGLGGFIKP
ncbi:hypothetical protein NL676_000217 [Syzygium grande]|nr:hypothetical protein NL676_000217 [Syzygium grande]